MTLDNPSITALPDIDSTPPDSKRAEIAVGSGEGTPSSSTSASSSDNSDTQIQDIPNQKQTATSEPSSQPLPDLDDAMKGVEEVRSEEQAGTTSPVMAAVPLPLPEEEVQNEQWWDLRMSWSGKIYELRVGGNDMVYDFRASIESLTSVPPDRQKLIGLTKGKLSTELDSTRIGALGLKVLGPGEVLKFTMIGTPLEHSFKDPTSNPELSDDFDVQYPNKAGATKILSKGFIAAADDPRNKRIIKQIIDKNPITVMNEPRPGKGLLVLDLDYTMVDTKPLLEGSLPAEECARPGLHEFLELLYPHYDIVVWSQTHWRWLESKLVEVGVIGGDRAYKICFVADRTTMFPVFSMRNGQPYKHEVKPLEYFWSSFPQWSAKNTVHIDDLSRNFAMNPGEGLRIGAFKGAGTIEGLRDRELMRLGPYLAHLANDVEDFSTVDHAKWKKWRPPQSVTSQQSPSGPPGEAGNPSSGPGDEPDDGSNES